MVAIMIGTIIILMIPFALYIVILCITMILGAQYEKEMEDRHRK